MTRPSKYPPEPKERAVRLVFESKDERGITRRTPPHRT